MSGALVPFTSPALDSYEGKVVLPEDEEDRLKTVDILDMEPEEDDPVLASLCKLVCSLIKVPAAAVSIVERDRQYFKSTGGTQPRYMMPRRMSFCQYTFLPRLPVVMVVEDTLKDERFANSPLVVAAPFPVRFYAGAPLISSTGHRVGAMCLIDRKPRKLSVEDYCVLNSCAEMVVRRIEEQKFDMLHTVATDKLLRSLNAFQQAVVLLDMGARGWPVLFANNAWISRLGFKKGTELRNKPFWDLFDSTVESEDEVKAGFSEQISQQLPFTVQLQLRSSSNKAPFCINFKPATQGCLDPYTPQIGISEAMEAHEAPADDLPYYFATIVDENHVERNPSAASEKVQPQNEQQRPAGTPADAAPASCHKQAAGGQNGVSATARGETPVVEDLRKGGDEKAGVQHKATQGCLCGGGGGESGEAKRSCIIC